MRRFYLSNKIKDSYEGIIVIIGYVVIMSGGSVEVGIVEMGFSCWRSGNTSVGPCVVVNRRKPKQM